MLEYNKKLLFQRKVIVVINENSNYYKNQVFKHFNLIESLANKMFVDPNDSLEATIFVINYLEKESWLKDQFKKRSSFKTFLISVVMNRYRDFFRTKYGRIRPPQWINDKDSIWKETFIKLYVQKMSRIEVEYHLTHMAENKLSKQEIQIIINTILAKVVNNFKNNNFSCEFSDEEIADNKTPYTSFEQEEKIRIALSLYTSIIQNESNCPGINNQLHQKYIKFHKILKLSVPERLFLKHIYQTDLSINKAGEMMSWNTNQSHSKYRQIKKRIKKALSISGLWDEINQLI